VLAVAHGPLRRSVDAARPFACGISAVLATLAVATPSALAADAPARVFEQVTPVHKYSSDVNAAQTASADGNAIAFNTWGAMEGGNAALFLSTYVARRGDDGWQTQGFTAIPPVAAPAINNSWTPLEPSADLRTFYAYASSLTPAGPDDQNSAEDFVAVHPGGTWDLVSKPDGQPTTASSDPAYYVGRSDDGNHVLFSTARAIVPGVAAGTTKLYDSTPGGVTLVSVGPDGRPIDDAMLGSRIAQVRPAAERTAISSDGSHIVFATPTQVYVRIDGNSTILVSASQKAGSVGAPAPTGATFMAAARNGSRIVFSSPDQLTDSAPTGGGIYAFDVTSRTLTLLAAVATPHIVKIAPDGGRVYFQSTGQLVPGKGTAGGSNLYVADDGSGLRYITTIDSASSADLYVNGESLSTAVISPDGTRLAFGTTANLTSYDSGGKREVYVYDDAAHRVTCASCPPGGAAATGSASIQDPSLDASFPSPGTHQPRGFDTANRLYFNTPQALAAGDTNGVNDAYAADPDGTRHLISTGTDPNGAYYSDNSVDGRDVFFITRGSLASTDDDNGVIDIYDARVGGRAAPVAPPACSGDACKPPASAAPAAESIASTTATDTSTAPPVSAEAGKTTFSVSAISAAARSMWSRTGTLSLKVKVSDAAEVRVSGRGAVGRKTLTVASGRALRTSAGSVTVRVRLTTAARSALTRSGRLTVRLAVSSTGTSTTKHTTVVLRAARKASR
jgi:hypothetical protein